MKSKLFFYILMITVINHNNVFSQYGDAYHAPDNARLERMRQASMDKMMDIHRSNMSTPNPSLSNNFSLYNIKSVKSPEEIAKEKARWEKYQAEEKAKLEERKREWKEREKIEGQYKIEYVRYGFEDDDASELAEELYLSLDHKLYSKSNNTRLLKTISLCKHSKLDFDSNFETSDFDKLAQMIVGYMSAGRTAFKDIAKLRNKFPEKKKECDLLELTCFREYCNKNIYIGDFKLHSDMLNRFLELEKVYPYEASIVSGFSRTIDAPYIQLSRKSKDKSLIEELLLKQISSPHPKDVFSLEQILLVTDSDDYSYPHYWFLGTQLFNSFLFFDENKSELSNFNKKDWKYIANQYNMSLVTFFDLFSIGLTDGDSPRQQLFINEKGGYYRKKFQTKKFNFEKFILEMESEPSAEDLNAYGLLVATGDTKHNPSDAIEYFKKSAQKGYYFGAYNYWLFASNIQSKYYNKEKAIEAKEILKGFTIKSDFDRFCYNDIKIPTGLIAENDTFQNNLQGHRFILLDFDKKSNTPYYAKKSYLDGKKGMVFVIKELKLNSDGVTYSGSIYEQNSKMNTVSVYDIKIKLFE